MKKIIRSKKGERFEIGLLLVAASISISLFSFFTEDSNITGFAVAEQNQEIQASQPYLLEFNDVSSLSTLSAGNYYIDGDGIVYWVDDESSPAIAKVNYLDESQKNRYIYIDREGRIGYILDYTKNEE